MCEWKAKAIIRFDFKLLILRYTIKLERNRSKMSCGPMEGLRTLHPMVRSSNPGMCSFSTLENKGLRGSLWHKETLALHLINNLRVEGIIKISFDLKFFILWYNIKLERK